MRSTIAIFLGALGATATACGGGSKPEPLGDPDPGGRGLRDGGAGGSGVDLDAAAREGGKPDDISVTRKLSPPFNPKDDGSFGVKLDPAGNIILDPSEYKAETTPLIWVANSDEGTISKVETRTGKEVARYRTGPGKPDPSRTTVSLNGDIVVVNRDGSSATKIAANPIDCTGPGSSTSSGPGDVLAWRDDKCVLWHTGFPAGSLGRAAAFDAEKGPTGELSTSVWIGLYNLQKVLQLDTKTGRVVAEVNVAPVHPYGAAVDKDHNIWVVGDDETGLNIGKINAPTKKWTAITRSPCAYGVTVDRKGRVWTGGLDCVARYTPGTDKWETLKVGTKNRGIAIDAKESVWVADTDFGVHQVDANKLTLIKDVRLPAPVGYRGYIGMAVDFDGMVWAINQKNNEGVRIDPKSYATTSVTVGTGPYTYSDMTGFQLRNAAEPFGSYLHVFEGCGEATSWRKLDWTASLPPSTSVKVRARTGKTPDDMRGAKWVIVATQPGDTSPVDLVAALGEAAKAPYLEVEFMLASKSVATTPILSSVSAISTCPPKPDKPPPTPT